ncbi:MAG: response regulator transcription factor [Lactimicrobium sp.]|uniref:response regulator transcription factor n=1 Tax=Lactimicrobium sp. TaxID=2563780 RepID=UPI002F351AD4
MSVILLVEDDASIQSSLSLYLKENGYEVLCAGTIARAREMVEKDPDLILLDITLPDGDGLSFFRSLDKQIPVIFLTARDDESLQIKSFDLGAEDYVEKPFSPQVLLSRIRNVLRRTSQNDIVVIDGLVIDMNSAHVSRDGKEIVLSAMEYRLLQIFLENRGKLLTREFLLDEIVESCGDYVNDNTLSVYIRRLRNKIEKDPVHPEILQTVRGLGYRFS